MYVIYKNRPKIYAELKPSFTKHLIFIDTKMNAYIKATITKDTKEMLKESSKCSELKPEMELEMDDCASA